MYAVIETTRTSGSKPRLDFYIYPHPTKKSAEAQRKRVMKILRESNTLPSDFGVLVAQIAPADEVLLEDIGERYSLTVCYSISSHRPSFEYAHGPLGKDGNPRNISRTYAREVLRACGVPIGDLPDWHNLLPVRGFVGQPFDES